MRRPLALADLVQAQVVPPPRLLLDAVAEAIDERWLSGHDLTVTYCLGEGPGQRIAVRVLEGERVHVAPSPGVGHGAAPAAATAASGALPPSSNGAGREAQVQAPGSAASPRLSATVALDARWLLCSLAGSEPPPGDPPLVVGDVEAVRELTRLAARAQGLERLAG